MYEIYISFTSKFLKTNENSNPLSENFLVIVLNIKNKNKTLRLYYSEFYLHFVIKVSYI